MERTDELQQTAQASGETARPMHVPSMPAEETSADESNGGARRPVRAHQMATPWRRLVRPLYERRWREEDMVWNSTRRRLCRADALLPGEAHRVLTQNKREELADALCNQAYSCLMAMAMWGGPGELNAPIQLCAKTPSWPTQFGVHAAYDGTRS